MLSNGEDFVAGPAFTSIFTYYYFGTKGIQIHKLGRKDLFRICVMLSCYCFQIVPRCFPSGKGHMYFLCIVFLFRFVCFFLNNFNISHNDKD